MKSFQFVRKLIFQENAALWSPEIGATLSIEGVVEGLVYNTNSRPHVYTHTYHTSDMMKMTFCEALGTIKRVDPNDHLFLIEFVWKFKEVPVRLTRYLTIYLL